jgi:hypothetical protein
VADRKATLRQVDDLGHMTMLGGEPGQLANARFKV